MEASYTKSIPLAKSNQPNRYDFMTRSAFTLIEIMVVIAIIVTVSGFVIAQIQVDDTKALAFETSKMVDTIEYMRSLSGASNARECPAFIGADAAKIPKLESVSLDISSTNSTSPNLYNVSTKCDSEEKSKVLITRNLQSGNTFTLSSTGQIVSFLGLNTVNAYPQEGYVEEIKMLSASKKDCSCIKILATGLPLTSTSCEVKEGYKCTY